MIGRVTHLTVREGDGDATRTGYWTVTAEDVPERDLFGTILVHVGEVYSWEIQRRVPNPGGRINTRLERVARGDADTHADAVAQVTAAWPASSEPPAPAPDRLERLIPRTER